LAAALRQLAPWRVKDGLARIYQHLCSVNKHKPKPGSLERKLFWFSSQRQQAKFGLGVALTADDKAELRIIASASNDYFPEPDWRDTVPWSRGRKSYTHDVARAAMEGTAFAIHAHGDTVVSGDIDISATME
jgi:hypothetical protein